MAHVIVIIILVAIVIFREATEKIVFEAFFLSLTLIFGELLHRTCLFLEEIRHRETRYQGEWKRVLRSTFTIKFAVPIGLAAVIFFPRIIYTGYETPFHQNNGNNCLQRYLLVALSYFVIRLQSLSPVEESEIKERKENVAEALAWSYYFEYLKLVLPCLEYSIGNSEQFRHRLSVKKLFILLPQTCFTYDDIGDADFRVRYAGNLPSIKIARFGRRNNSFSHSVYRLQMPRQNGGIDEYHFVIEYAMPLMSLYDMSNYPGTSVGREERDHQVNFDLFL